MRYFLVFLAYWVTNAFIDSEFFESDKYNNNDPCYNEFVKGEKENWEECCSQDRNATESDNCEKKYFPFDVCKDDMVPGFVSVASQDRGSYPTFAWQRCCEINCTSLSCNSGYCYNVWDVIEEGLETWAIVLISVFCGVLGIVGFFLLCFCCCIRPSKAAAKAAAAKQHEAAAAAGEGGPHAVYIDQEILMQNSNNNIPAAGPGYLPAGQYVNADTILENPQYVQHHVVQHVAIDGLHQQNGGNPAIFEDGSAYVHAPAYDPYNNAPY